MIVDVDFRPPRCLILRETTTQGQVAELAAGLGGEQTSVRPADPAQDVEYQVEWELGPFTLAYAEEPDMEFRYVKLYGITNELAELGADLEAMLESELDACRLDELIADVDECSDPQDRSWALIRAGIGAPPAYEERFFTRIRDALRDDDPAVRYGALLAIAYTPWPEYAEPVAQQLEHEKDADLREAAKVLVDGFASRAGTPATS